MVSKSALDKRYEALEQSRQVQLEISKAEALFMFKSTNEPIENYDYLSVDNDHINHIGIEYIDLGCKYFELEDYAKSSSCFTKGAECLELIHSFKNYTLSFGSYYGLLAAMSFYSGFQYSRAFVLIKKLEEDTIIASLLSLFLKRKFDELTDKVERMVVNHDYKEEQLCNSVDIDEACGKVFEITIAKCLYCIVQYFYTGDETLIDASKNKLVALLDIARIENLVDLWWVVRLILVIIDGFRQSSLWSVLGQYFDLRNDNSLARKYVLSLIYKNVPISELFLSQRAVLPQLFTSCSQGVVVSIPTSSGKTRIAELAILNAIIKNPDKRVLYIAPFRSLAYEIENTLGDLFATAELKVSHLYGGSLFTSLDVEELSEANVVIATPEKAKAIFRCKQDFFNDLSLVIMDEGHLLGGDGRQIGNEIFYEELKNFLKKSECKYLLLSAVLPNTEDLSMWLTGSENNVFRNDWRPSKQICGMLIWNGASVKLEWYKGNKISSFNRDFVLRYELPKKSRERVVHYYPESKKEAIVETAKKLEYLGSTLIYVTKKSSCKTYAEAYARSIKDEAPYHFKNEIERKIFELVCKESYSDTSLYDYVTRGIFCHNADLFADVRISLEKLMQSEHPRVIIATSTLSQGVNLGVSTVIMTSVTNARNYISKKDFWNLAGRAGRAFVDEEGKILVAFEYDYKKKKWQNESRKKKIVEYFNNGNLDSVTSGLVRIIFFLHKIAENTGTAFEQLLTLIAENKTIPSVDLEVDLEQLMSKLDDCLLSMHNSYSTDRKSLVWIEKTFSYSLAYIQASKGVCETVTQQDVISFIKYRLKGILKKIEDDTDWHRLVQSGLPLQKSIEIDTILGDIDKVVSEYHFSNETIEDTILLLKNIELIISKLPSFETKYIEMNRIDEIRNKWLSGEPLCDMNLMDKDEIEVIQKYYSYELPWFLNGISNMMRNDNDYDEETSDILSKLALLVETGLPNKMAVKIYRSGVRSRACATEFSQFMSRIIFGENYPSSLVKYEIIRLASSWHNLSELGQAWIEILKEESKMKHANRLEQVSPFGIKNKEKDFTTFKVRIIDGDKYFFSLDLDKVERIKPSKKDFSIIQNLKGVYFSYNEELNLYEMKNLNPYIKIN